VGHLFFVFDFGPELGRKLDAQKGNARSRFPTASSIHRHYRPQRRATRARRRPHPSLIPLCLYQTHCYTEQRSLARITHINSSYALLVVPHYRPLYLPHSFLLIRLCCPFYLHRQRLALTHYHVQQRRSILEQQWPPEGVPVFDLENVQAELEGREGKTSAATAKGSILSAQQVHELAVP
jgi:hypothetical protein